MRQHKKNDCSTVISDRIDVQNRTILIGDVLEQMKKIPDESIDCEISSPPYWALRNYGVEGQWGLESTFQEYLEKMKTLMRELKRVLKPSGTCWINLGDCYGAYRSSQDQKMVAEKQEHDTILGYEKSRLGIPERFYIQSIDDGWIARNHIPWVKSNPMPSSVKDRFTNTWESIFFFAKSQKYYFNLNAVREKPKTQTKPFNLRVREAKKGRGQLKLGDDPRAWKATDQEFQDYNEKGERKQDNVIGSDGKPKANYKGFNERWVQNQHNVTNLDADSEGYNPLGKNPGDVFYINPKPFPEAHFATFPIDLPLRILKCACPRQVCVKCGKPREPILKPTKEYQNYLNSIKGLESGNLEIGYQNYKNKTQSTTEYEAVVDWTQCGCNAEFKSGIVLDPFFGSGTCGVAAEMLGLNWIGIELKEEYTKIARKRLEPFRNSRLF